MGEREDKDAGAERLCEEVRRDGICGNAAAGRAVGASAGGGREENYKRDD